MYWEGALHSKEAVSLNLHPKSVEVELQEVGVQDSRWFGDTAPAAFEGSMAMRRPVKKKQSIVQHQSYLIPALCIGSAAR